MNLYLDNGSVPMPEFQLPDGFTAEMSRTNPFLTDEGSQSVPMTLPASEHNMKLIGWQHHLNPNKRPMRKTQAIISNAGIWIRGTLFIDQANYKDGIECTFYTNEGQLYEKLQNIKLGDLEWPVNTEGLSGSTEDDKVRSRLTEFIQIIKGEKIHTDYYIFPVKSSFPIKRKGKNYSYEGNLTLNEVSSGDTEDSIYFPQKSSTVFYIDPDDTEIKLPVGYGVTPFLKISFIVKHIFQSLGYDIDTGFFSRDQSLYRLVLLNNTADAICKGGILYYKYLIPENLPVTDFLDTLRYKFGIEFIEKGQTIEIRQWSTTLRSKADINLTNYIRDVPTIEFVDKKKLQITMSRSLNHAETEVESYREFYNKYGNVKEIKDIVDASTSKISLLLPVYQYVYRRESNTAFYKAAASSTFFDLIPDGDFETEDIGQKDLAVPVYYEITSFEKTNTFIAPIINGIRHKTTDISYNNSDEDSNTNKKNEENGLDVMMCFSVPGLQKDIFRLSAGAQNTLYYPMGSSFLYKADGTQWGSINLQVTGKYNLYDRFYTELDEMLQKANQKIIIDASLPQHMIVTMDITTPKIISGQKVLIERIDYVVGRPDLCQITARTLHLFPDETTT